MPKTGSFNFSLVTINKIKFEMKNISRHCGLIALFGKPATAENGKRRSEWKTTTRKTVQRWNDGRFGKTISSKLYSVQINLLDLFIVPEQTTLLRPAHIQLTKVQSKHFSCYCKVLMPSEPFSKTSLSIRRVCIRFLSPMYATDYTQARYSI